MICNMTEVRCAGIGFGDEHTLNFGGHDGREWMIWNKSRMGDKSDEEPPRAGWRYRKLLWGRLNGLVPVGCAGECQK